MRWWWTVLALGGCSGDEPAECDNGTPTCDSQLTVLLPDPRTQFRLRVSDSQGMDVDVDCPGADTGPTAFGDYQAECGGGRVIITTFLSFGDQVSVTIDEGLQEQYHPEYSYGADFCGNECDIGTVQL